MKHYLIAISTVLLAVVSNAQVVLDSKITNRSSDTTKLKSAQANMNDLKESYVRRVSNAISDSLKLNKDQRSRMLDVNFTIEREKTLAINTIKRPALWNEIRKIEKKRHVMYQSILNHEQFRQYEKQKSNLLYKMQSK